MSRPPAWNPPGVVFDGEDGGPGQTPKATGDNGTSSSPDCLQWCETVKLNYGYNFVDQTSGYTPRPRTWDLMDQVLAYWQELGVDGFRCDFAHYVPAEAWAFLIRQARARDTQTFFFAEA